MTSRTRMSVTGTQQERRVEGIVMLQNPATHRIILTLHNFGVKCDNPQLGPGT